MFVQNIRHKIGGYPCEGRWKLLARAQERGSQNGRDYTGGQSWTSSVNNEDRYDHRRQMNKNPRVRPYVKPRTLMVLPPPWRSWPVLALKTSPSPMDPRDSPATVSEPLNDSAFESFIIVNAVVGTTPCGANANNSSFVRKNLYTCIRMRRSVPA